MVETVRGSRRDAEKRLARLVAGIDTGQAGLVRRVRFHELVDEWWATSTGHLSPHTRIGYRGMLDRYLLPTFGKQWINRFSPLAVERWYAGLVGGSGPSPVTVRKIHVLLSGILKAAAREVGGDSEGGVSRPAVG